MTAVPAFVPQSPRSHVASAHAWVVRLLLAAVVLLSGAGIVGAAPGDSPAEPVPLGEATQAGPWQMSVAEGVFGPDAAALAAEASPLNGQPIDGATFIAVRVAVTNTSEVSQVLDAADFLLLGDGWVRRLLGIIPPEPAIDQEVPPGESSEGWVVLGGPDDGSAYVMAYDSLTVAGNWADTAFALTDQGGVTEIEPGPTSDDVGTDVATAAPVGTALVTDDWQITVVEVLRGAAVYDLYPPSDFRTTALGRNQATDGDGFGAVGWLAIRVNVTNTSGGNEPAYLPSTAFSLAQADGTALPNGLILTPPDPDAAGWYAPGQPREGYVVFEILNTWDGDTVRFLPYRTDDDVRYVGLQ